MDKTIQIKCKGSGFLELDQLSILQKNLKDLSNANYEKFKSQILKLGYSSPIHVWENKGKYNILDGTQRTRTLCKMRDEGYTIPPLPIVSVEAKSMKEAKEKILSLTSQFGEITGQGLYEFMHEAELDIGDLKDLVFPEIDVDKFVDEYFDKPSETNIDESNQDDVPEVKDTDIKIGDMFQLGKHRLICGSCTDIKIVKKIFGSDTADICFTSPPYNAGVSSRLREKNASGDDSFYNEYSDSQSTDEYTKFLSQFTNICLDYCETSFINIQMISKNKISFVEWLSLFKDQLKDILIWNKTFGQPAMAKNVYNSAFEFVVIFSRHNNTRSMPVKKEFRGKYQNIFDVKKGSKEEIQKSHKAVFPVALAEMFLERHCKETVYDPFGGTGTTLIAAEKLGRKCFTVELDPHYCQVIIDRCEMLTDIKAVKLN